MERFKSFGLALRERWARLHFAESCFAELALEELERSRLDRGFELGQLLHQLAVTPFTVRQHDSNFGQPPINLYYDEHFYIEALFWVDGTTTIHEHAFSGAFCVLDGSSVHARYDFELDREVGDRIALGRLRLADVELLARGDCRPLIAGSSFIHAVFHLERPTLSLVVRTHQAHTHTIQRTYHAPGLGVDGLYRPAALKKQLALLEMLLTTGHAQLDSFAEALIDHADVFSLTQVLQHLNLAPNGQRLVHPLLRRARNRYPELAQTLEPALATNRLQASLIERRRVLSNPELRFFLALLLNVPGRSQILNMVQQRFPKERSTEKIMGWLQVMQEVTDASGTALGLELDPASRWVLQQLLEGRPQSELEAEAKLGRGPATAADVAKLSLMAPFHSVLGPLLSDD